MQLHTRTFVVLAHVIVVVLAAATFLPGYDNFFAGDDFDWLFTTVKTVSNPGLFFGAQSNFVRHGESLYFILNYLIAGFSYPVFFLSSLLLHLINVLLVCGLLGRLGCPAVHAVLIGQQYTLDVRVVELVHAHGKRDVALPAEDILPGPVQGHGCRGASPFHVDNGHSFRENPLLDQRRHAHMATDDILLPQRSHGTASEPGKFNIPSLIPASASTSR